MFILLAIVFGSLYLSHARSPVYVWFRTWESELGSKTSDFNIKILIRLAVYLNIKILTSTAYSSQNDFNILILSFEFLILKYYFFKKSVDNDGQYVVIKLQGKESPYGKER